MKQETHLAQTLQFFRTRLLVMCAAVQKALDEAGQALKSGDAERARAVIEGDGVINDLENEIDALALSILARTQPVARDLRFVVSGLKLVVDVERIGDEAVSIAERVLLLEASGEAAEALTPDIFTLLEQAKASYAQAVQALVQEDGKLALKVCRAEDESTQAEVAVIQKIMAGISARGPRATLTSAMHGILISRALNRIWRRSANIAEQVWFINEGENLKHRKVADCGALPE